MEKGDNMSTVALIVGAGRGARAGAGPPKQYRPLQGRCALARAVDACRRHPRIDHVVVAINPGDAALYAAALGPDAPETVPGGGERQDTVRRALEALADTNRARVPDIVLIHDAARPFLPPEVIDRALDALAHADGACAALPAVETMRRAENHDSCGELVSRDGLWRAQTPQAFRFAPLLDAHQRFADDPVTDDAEIARRAGLRVALTEGAPENVKLTTPADFTWAERWLAAETAGQQPLLWEPRIGTGFDVHAFGPNADGASDHVTLCGVRIPHENGLKGHSDADVALHALTDAILGAISGGDIGAHFPPSDPKWKGAASDQFLARAVDISAAAGARITQLDVTLICERPKIGPHIPAMRARLAEITHTSPARISVKATTTEQLGFTGRREGVAALATASLMTPGEAP